MMNVLQQKHSVLTFDEAIYYKAKEIQWHCQDEFKKTVIRFGGFHTAMTFMAVIGKRYEKSGLEANNSKRDLIDTNTSIELVENIHVLYYIRIFICDLFH